MPTAPSRSSRCAHAQSPHYADPLEGWGEALIARNRSDLALAKFEEAAQYAPKWGRLHLKWGEALLWSGDKAGAQKQFAIAAKLHLRHPKNPNWRRCAMAETTDDRIGRSPDGASADPAALHAAMGAAGAGEEARDYLRKQSALTDLQIENLRDVDRFEISHLRWQQFSDRMRGLLQVLVALLIGGVLAGAASLVWNAAHDHDLIVDAFTVPPDIAQTGLTGRRWPTGCSTAMARSKTTATARSVPRSPSATPPTRFISKFRKPASRSARSTATAGLAGR